MGRPRSKDTLTDQHTEPVGCSPWRFLLSKSLVTIKCEQVVAEMDTQYTGQGTKDRGAFEM